jgi:hypothetical protein
VLDRVSQFLLKEVIYCNKKYSIEDTVFRIIFFKIFNLQSTWIETEKHFNEVSLKTFDFDKYSKFFTNLKKTQAIYNCAYIMCANKVYGFNYKHENHLYLLHKMFKEDNLPKKLTTCKTFKDAFNVMVSYPLIGNFLAYQYVTDLNYSEHFNWDDNFFTIAGPGSKRANPSLKSNRTKIKTKYKKTNNDINYILPKKWNAGL